MPTTTPQKGIHQSNAYPHHCVVMGNPIAHSKSPLIHEAFAHQVGLPLTYRRLLCADETSFVASVRAFFLGGGLGINVTLPFKECAHALCLAEGKLSAYAKAAGAVNTLMMHDGILYGDNTDGRGLVADLAAKGIDLQGKSVAILGAGGAARGSILPLLQAGATLEIFNRTLAKAQALCLEFDNCPAVPHLATPPIAKPLTAQALSGQFDLIINATSAGTTGQHLLPPDAKIKTTAAYDMMYGKDTEFLRHFADAITFDGTGMLINQAALAFELWTGIPSARLDLPSVARLIG